MVTNHRVHGLKRSLYRGDLYAHIDEDGDVDFQVVRAERRDAPAMVMACLLMAIKLTQMIDDEETS